jgi:hypothetical protein
MNSKNGLNIGVWSIWSTASIIVDQFSEAVGFSSFSFAIAWVIHISYFFQELKNQKLRKAGFFKY